MLGLDNPAATGGMALLAALLIQYLKNTSWATWVRRDTEKANLALSIMLAFLTSIGIHFSWDAGHDTFAIVGVQAALTHNVWQWVIQWAAQHGVYKGVIAPAETLGEIRTLLARVLEPPSVSVAEQKVVVAARAAVVDGSATSTQMATAQQGVPHVQTDH